MKRRLVPQRVVAGAAPEHRVSTVGRVLAADVAEQRRNGGVDLIVQAGVGAAARDGDAVARVRELEAVGGGGPDGLVQLRDERAARLVPVGVHRRERIVTPQVGLEAGRVVLPGVLRVAHHRTQVLAHVVVDAQVFLPPVDRRRQRRHPVVAAAGSRRRVGRRVELQEQESGGTEAIGGNLVARERLAGQRVDGRRLRAAVDRRSAEVAGLLGVGRDKRIADRAALLAIPLERSEEVQLVLDDRPAEGAAEIVTAQLLFRLVGDLQEVVAGVQRVVAREVEGASLELVVAAARDDVDLGATGLAVLGAVAVAEDLELLDGVHRRVHQNRAVGADVVVVRAIHGPQVGGDRAAADGQIGSAEQPLVLDVEEVRGGDARHQRGQLQEVAPVERQLAHLLAGDHTRDVAADGLHLHGGGLDADGLLHLPGIQREVHGPIVGDVQLNVGALTGLEPLEFDLDGVRADRQLAKRGTGRSRWWWSCG